MSFHQRAFVLVATAACCQSALAQQLAVRSVAEQGGLGLILNSPNSTTTTTLGRVRSITANGPNAFAAVMQTWRQGESVVWGWGPQSTPPGGHVLFMPSEFKEEVDGGEVVVRQTLLFEQACGISADGEVHFSTMVLDTLDTALLNVGQGKLVDSLWMGSNQVTAGLMEREDEALLGEHEGKFWRSVSQPGMTFGGTPYWLGTTASQAGDRPTDVAVWLGVGKPIRVLGTNDRITDYGLRVSGAGLSKFAMSPDGTRLFAIANLTGFPNARQQSVVSVDMNDQPPKKRIHVETGDLIGGSVSGSPGWEPWKEFTHIAVSDANGCNPRGAWFAAGEVSQNTTSRFVLTRENSLLLREGQQIGRYGQTNGLQYTLVGRPLALAVNPKGDWATIWYAEPRNAQGVLQNTGSGEVVIVNGKVVLAPSDVVDHPTTDFDVLDVRPHLAIGDRKLDGQVDVYAVVRKFEQSTGAKNEHIVQINLFAGQVDCCVADMSSGAAPGVTDGGVDINDLLYFLLLFETGNVAGDIDNGTGTGTHDNAVDINDLLYFLVRFEAGC